MDRNLPGSSIHGIFQVRVLEWVAIFFSRGSPWPRDRHCRQTLYCLRHQGRGIQKQTAVKFTEQIIICLKSRPTNTWSLPRSTVLQECSYKDFFYTVCKTYHYKIIALFKLQFNTCWKNMAKKAAFRRIHQVVLTPKSLGKKSCLMTVFFLISNYAFPNWSILVTLL